jgi:hypothetical protein
MMILKMSSGIRAGIRPSYGRSSSWFEPLYHYYCQAPYRVAVVLGRGKLAKIEVALSNWEGYQVKLLSGFQIKQQMLQWGSTRCGQGKRALKAERAKKLKPAKTAGERRSRGEGNSPAWRRGGTIGG